MTKYTLTEKQAKFYRKNGKTITLYKIVYTPEWLKANGLTNLEGGYLESEKNLSQEGKCVVVKNAWVYGNARVEGDAQIGGEAHIYGNAHVYGNARCLGDVKICADADINSGTYRSLMDWINPQEQPPEEEENLLVDSPIVEERTAPTLEEVSNYCMRCFTFLKKDPEEFWKYYEKRDWEIDGHKITRWKALLCHWNLKSNLTIADAEREYLISMGIYSPEGRFERQTDKL